ncbi:efflux RND transporter periplasmic adaptor subunit [Planctomycetes bacterium K23_9]|uniref:Putative multidrug resistance protein EmrK n=1 Tax=Stieleria marina TaxID=1930275 RepID=A0A517NRX8_9BACT|nr:putative multidrug resistance protein EmrK [Planctomycetes bacterium K23_9]
MNDSSTENGATSPIRFVLSLAILGAGIAAFFWMGTPHVETREPDRPDAAVVETSLAAKHTEGIDIVVDGSVVPFKQIQIAAQVSGRVQTKSPQCRTGKAVREGDLLIRIDPKDYELEAKRLKEELTQADAMLNELQTEVDTIDNQIASAKKQLELDERQLKRTTEIFDRRAASETELDTSRRTALGSRSNLQTLQDQKSQINQRRIRLESAKALGATNLEKANLALSRTEIRSPIDGVVVSESVEQDGYIQTGNTVIVLQDSSRLDVTCQLHMQQMHWLWQSKSDDGSGSEDDTQSLATAFPATSANVTYEMGGKVYAWDGLIDRYDGAGIDDQTRMVPCRVHIDSPTSARVQSDVASRTDVAAVRPPTLMTGMFVKVHVRAKPPIPLVRLPQRALQPGNVVWTVVDGSLVRKEIDVATSDAEYVVAYEQPGGLQVGDQIVVSPLASPNEGMKATLLADFEKQKPKPAKNRRAGGPAKGGRPDADSSKEREGRAVPKEDTAS